MTRALQIGAIASLLCLCACVSKTHLSQDDADAVKACFNHNGTWDYEYHFCKNAKADTTTGVSKKNLEKDFPWAKWDKKK